MLCCFSHVRLFVTLWTVAGQAPLSMGFSKGYGSGFPCLPPGDSANPGSEPASFMSGGFFTTSGTWKAHSV